MIPALTTWLVQSRTFIAGRFKHRSLLLFTLAHFAALLLLFLLTLSLRELNASTSHLLRHVVDQANLTSVIFRSRQGVVGNWKDAPALVVTWEEDGRGLMRGTMCRDEGTVCWDLGAEEQQVFTPANVTSPAKSQPSTSLLDGEDEDSDDEEEDGDSDADSDAGSDSDSESDDEDDEERRRFVRRTINLTSSIDRSNSNVVQVDGIANEPLFISQQCAMSFGWAINSLDNLIREEIVLACFFVWIFALAVIGVLYTSMPHLVALALSLTMSSIWIGVEIHLSKRFMSTFLRTVEMRCDGTNILPSYLASRIGLQASSLAINVLFLIGSAVLCWRLRDHFGWETFQRIGASIPMRRMYTLVLAMSIILQLDVFVLVTLFALWLDQITYGVTNYYMTQCRAWQALAAVMIVSLIPWLFTAWGCIRTESKKHFNLFVAASAILLAGWAASFSNRMFRLQFVSWAFFGSLGTLAAVLTVASVVLAVARRMTFDRGLKDFLEFDMVEEEKGTGVVISSTSLPTFSSAFPTTLPPRAMYPAPVADHGGSRA